MHPTHRDSAAMNGAPELCGVEELCGGGEDGAFGAAGVAVNGALFVAGGTVFALAGDGFQVGGVVLRGHLDVVEEELGEGGIAVEDAGAFRVDVDEVKGGLRCFTSPP